MIAILAYAIGVMYTPGPINLLGLNSGVTGKAREHIGFFAGVGAAMFILFIALGFVGLRLINPTLIPYVSLVGCAYILYIAWKVARSSAHIKHNNSAANTLSFWNGLIMQLLNPKALVATLPISTIQFPAAGISGITMVLWSIMLAILAFGAPSSYALAGLILGKRIENPTYFKIFNGLMSALLVCVSISIGFEHVFLKLVG